MNNAYLAALALVLAAGPLCAQLGEIRGVVLEAGTLHPIAGARIIYMRMPGEPNPPATFVGEQTTDATGAFQITSAPNGRYSLGIQKEGYPLTSFIFTLTDAHPREEVRAELKPVSLVTGLLIDRNTGEPASAQISLVAVRYVNGNGLAGGGPRVSVAASVGADGVFEARNVQPGRYAIVVTPSLWSKSTTRHTVEFKAADRETIDEDYERSYWPGGGSADVVLPLEVTFGRTNTGTLALRKTLYYRAHVTFDSSNCGEGEVFHARVLAVYSNDLADEHGRLDVMCGQDFLLRGIPPGSYQLEMVKQSRDVAGRRFGEVPFVITDKNVKLTARVASGVSLRGTVVRGKGVTAPLSAVRVNATRMPASGFPEDQQTVPVDSEGRFVLENLPQGTIRIGLLPLPAAWIMQEANYNGRTVVGDSPRLIDWNGQGEIEVVLEDQPASLSGVVTNSNGAEKEPIVILLHWPPPQRPNGVHTIKTVVTGDPEGAFRFGSLPAGEYRVLAVPASARERIEEPGVLDGLVSRAEKLMVSRGSSATVSLRVITSVP